LLFIAGSDVLQDEIFLNGTIVLPHKEIKDSQLEVGTIIM
jgi:mannose-1-phosphate guanylyltransferase